MAIYFVQAGEGGPVKIGFAQDIKLRMNKMRSDNYEMLRLVAAFVGGVDDERALHNMFAAHHKHREWFYASVLKEMGRVTLAPHSVDDPPAARVGTFERTEEHCQAIRDGILRRLDDPEYRARRKAAQQPGGSEWLKRKATLARNKMRRAAWRVRMGEAAP